MRARAAAGSVIPNSATAEFSIDGTPVRVSSNVALRPLDELLDVRLTSPVSPVPVASDRMTTVPVLVINDGNGSEPFVFEATATGAVIEAIALDRDGDGRFDPTIDLALAPGAATPPLTAGATVQILVLLRGDGAAAGSLTVGVRAVTGSGTPGTTFTGQGDAGVDAVVGSTTAAARIDLPFTLADTSADAPDVSLLKSQQVVAPDGSGTPRAGATIRYSIQATFGGTIAAPAARVVDAVPAGTAYVPGSLRLDGIALTDIADADPGSFDGAAVAVLLGDVPAPATHTVQFEVTIQ